ncbi:MAG: hypothetical protein KC619_15230 [Myxococcales bacterium]|nr:hypothetical protein [Myxococcales bacterium]
MWRRWQGRIEASRAGRARDALLALAPELGATVVGAELLLEDEPDTRVGIDTSSGRVALHVRARIDPPLGLDLMAPAPRPGHHLLEASHIRSLTSDAVSLGLETWLGDEEVVLVGAVALDPTLVRTAGRLAAKLAARLPVLREQVIGPIPPPSRAHAVSWRGLATAWELDADATHRELTGTRGGLPVALRASLDRPGETTRIEIDVAADELALVLASPDDASVPLPVRGGFGRLWVRVGSDALSEHLHGSRALLPFERLVPPPYRLTWDPEGLVLTVGTLLTDTLHPTAEALLRLAHLLKTDGSAPYR